MKAFLTINPLFATLFLALLGAGCSNNKSFLGSTDDTPKLDNIELSFRDGKTNSPIPDSGFTFSLGTTPLITSTITNTGTAHVTLTKSQILRSSVLTAKSSFRLSDITTLSGIAQIFGVGTPTSTRNDFKHFGKVTFLGCWSESSRTTPLDTDVDSFSLPANGVCDFQFRIVADTPMSDNYNMTLTLGGAQKQKKLSLMAKGLVSHEIRIDNIEDDYFPLASSAQNIAKPFQFRKSINGEAAVGPVTFSVEQPQDALLTVTPSVASCTGDPGEVCTGTLAFSYTGAQPTQNISDYPVTIVVKEGSNDLTKRVILVQIFKDAIPLDKMSKKLNATQMQKGRYTHDQDLTDQNYNHPMVYAIGDGKLWYSNDQGASFHETINPTNHGGNLIPLTGVTAFSTASVTQEVIVSHDAGVNVVNIRTNTMYPVAGIPEDDQEMIAMTARVPALDELGMNVGDGQGGNPISSFHNRVFMLSKKGNIYVAFRAPGDKGVYAIDRAYADMDKLKEQILKLRSPASTELPKFSNLYYVSGGDLVLASDEGLIGLKTDDNTSLAVNPTLFSADTATKLGPLLYSNSRTTALPSGCTSTQIKSLIRSYTSDGLHLGLTTTNGTTNDCTFDISRKFIFFAYIDYELVDKSYPKKFEYVRVLNHNTGDFAGLELLTYLSSFGFPNLVLVTRNVTSGQIGFFQYDPSNNDSPTPDAPPTFDVSLTGSVSMSPGGLALFQNQAPSAAKFYKLSVSSSPSYIPINLTAPSVLETNSIVDYYRKEIDQNNNYAYSNQYAFTLQFSVANSQVHMNARTQTVTNQFRLYPDDDPNMVSNDVLSLDTQSIVDFPFQNFPNQNQNFSVALLGENPTGDPSTPHLAILNADRSQLYSGISANVLDGALIPTAATYQGGQNYLYVGVDGDVSDVGGVYKIDLTSNATVSRIVHLENPAYGLTQAQRKVTFVKLYNNDTLFVGVVGKIFVYSVTGGFDEDTQSGINTIDTSTIDPLATVTSAEFLAENGGDFVVTFSTGAIKLVNNNSFDTDHSVLNNSNLCLANITDSSTSVAFEKGRSFFDGKTWYTFYSNKGVCVFVYQGFWALHAGPLAAPGGDIKRAILEGDMVVVYPSIGMPQFLQIPHAFNYPSYYPQNGPYYLPY